VQCFADAAVILPADRVLLAIADLRQRNAIDRNSLEQINCMSFQ